MASKKLKLEDQIGQARQGLEAGEIDQTIALCRHIFRYYPRCLEVTRILGEAYTEKRLLDEAEKLLTFVLNADPQDVLGYVDRGFVAYERSQLDDAIAYYERALELDPNIEQLRGELLRLNRERYGNNRPKLRLTRAGLANHRLRDGSYSQAIEEYTAILRDSPERLDIQVGLLEAYWRNKDFVRAESLAIDLLNEQADLVKANLILWHIYGVRRHLEKATSYLERAQMLDPLNLMAEHLFGDAETTDNAISYISMLEAPTIPAFEPGQVQPEDNWLPDWISSDTVQPADEPEAELATVGQSEQSVSLADLGLDSDMIMSLIADSEQHTAERLNQAKLEQDQLTANDQQAALQQLDELRKGEETDFGGWLEDLSANAPQIDLNATNQNINESESEKIEAFDLEPFDLGIGEEQPALYQLFDNLETAAQAKNQPMSNPDWSGFDEAAAREAGTENNITAEASKWREIDLDSDLKPFDAAVAAEEPFVPAHLTSASDNKPIETASTEVTISANEAVNSSRKETDSDFKQSNGTTRDAATEQAQDYAAVLPVESGASKQQVFQWRDEQGPIPDFVLEAATAAPVEQSALPANTQQQVSKENAQMPIKKGGNEDNDLFDWEKEELPDYLQAFAMDEDEATSYGLAMPAAPQADITTPPARIRSREMEMTEENEVPGWLNPATRSSGTNSADSNPIDLNQAAHSANAGNLPGWLEAAELEDGKNGESTSATQVESFDLAGIQPFSPFATQDFEAFAPPNQPAENSFPDMMPFSLNDLQGGAAQPAPTPPPMPAARPEPQPFTFSGFDDMDLGDLQPFNPAGGANTVTPASAMQKSKPPVPPTPPPMQMQPPAQTKSPTQPLSPSPRPPAIPRQNVPPASSPFDDLSDLQPFDFGAGQSESIPPSAPLTPNFPQMPAFSDAESGFQSFDLGNVKPFSLEDFAEPAASSNARSFNPPPPPADFRSSGAGANKGNENNFDLNDDLGPDLEPFSMEGFDDIPGLSKGPTRFGNMSNLPDEPFYPTPARRPRDNEAATPLEPGHEAPLRQFPWIKNRREAEKQSQQELENGEPMFKRLAEKRRQQMDAEGIEQPQNQPETNEEFGLTQPLLSFDEIEALSQTEDKAATTPTPVVEQLVYSAKVEQPQAEQNVSQANQQLNDQLMQALEDDTFDWNLEAALPQQNMQAAVASSNETAQNFDLEAFDLSEFAFKPAEAQPEPPVEQTTAVTTPTEAPLTNFSFEAEPVQQAAETELPPVQIVPSLAPTVVAQPKLEAATAQVEPQPQANKPTAMEIPESQPTQNAAATATGDNNGKTQTIENYLQLIKNNPRNAAANVKLAEAYYQQGQYNQAITYYTGAIKLADKPTLEQMADKLQNIVKEAGATPRFHHVLGDVYMKQGQANLALNEYKLAISTAKAR